MRTLASMLLLTACSGPVPPPAGNGFAVDSITDHTGKFEVRVGDRVMPMEYAYGCPDPMTTLAIPDVNDRGKVKARQAALAAQRSCYSWVMGSEWVVNEVKHPLVRARVVVPGSVFPVAGASAPKHDVDYWIPAKLVLLMSGPGQQAR